MTAAYELPFSPDVYARRVRDTRALMRSQGIDLLLVNALPNVFYLTGFSSIAFGQVVLLLPVDGPAHWVMRKTDLSNIRALAGQLWVTEATGVPDNLEFLEVLAEQALKHSSAGSRLAIEQSGKATMSPADHAAFVRLLDGRELVNSSGLVETLRAVKAPEELAIMRRAGTILDKAVRAGFEALEAGMTDSALAEVVVGALIHHGSDRMSQMPNVCAGPRSARAHVTWSGSVINAGDIVNLEPSCSVRNYHVHCYRFWSVGQPHKLALDMHDACRRALDAGYRHVRPGMTSDAAARFFVREMVDAGFEKEMVTRPGYGIGLGFAPGWAEENVTAVRPGSQQVLEAGMCFHLCPILYRDGLGAVGASMPSLLTENGFEALCPNPPDLLVK
jgi:Xaa-Pro dipeptidase